MKTASSLKKEAASRAAVLVSERYEATTVTEGLRRVIVVGAEQIGEGGEAFVRYEVQLPGWAVPRVGMVQFLWKGDGSVSSAIWWTHDSQQ
ncbi:hypothetical protein [Luteolibacter sp. LG18]|uniref:hypothetical protein n=1 Tax=Luteolibacter sp. LG18 TaxID=2819286 RepID=UPI002B2C5347|nr:hypothetical protein llg_36040 [Luteolibacter sp. LG18]